MRSLVLLISVFSIVTTTTAEARRRPRTRVNYRMQMQNDGGGYGQDPLQQYSNPNQHGEEGQPDRQNDELPIQDTRPRYQPRAAVDSNLAAFIDSLFPPTASTNPFANPPVPQNQPQAIAMNNPFANPRNATLEHGSDGMVSKLPNTPPAGQQRADVSQYSLNEIFKDLPRKLKRIIRGDDKAGFQGYTNMCWAYAVREMLQDYGLEVNPATISARTHGSYNPQWGGTMEQQRDVVKSYGIRAKLLYRPARSKEELKAWLADGYGKIIRVRGNGDVLHAVYVQRESDEGDTFLVSDSAKGKTLRYNFEQLRSWGWDQTVGVFDPGTV